MDRFDALLLASLINALAMTMSVVFLKTLSLIPFFAINLIILGFAVAGLGKLPKDHQKKVSLKWRMMIAIPSICGMASVIIKQGV